MTKAEQAHAIAIAVRVTYLCSRSKKPVMAVAVVKPGDLEIDTEQCHTCGSHTKATVYVNECEVCWKSHWVTIRWDDLGSWGKHPSRKKQKAEKDMAMEAVEAKYLRDNP